MVKVSSGLVYEPVNCKLVDRQTGYPDNNSLKKFYTINFIWVYIDVCMCVFEGVLTQTPLCPLNKSLKSFLTDYTTTRLDGVSSRIDAPNSHLSAWIALEDVSTVPLTFHTVMDVCNNSFCQLVKFHAGFCCWLWSGVTHTLCLPSSDWCWCCYSYYAYTEENRLLI